jgi:IS4 transposase
LPTFWTREGIDAMHHHNSVLHGLTKHIPWAAFDRLVDEHGTDWRVRRLSTKSQLIALLYGQLSGAVSLREIVTGLESHAARLYHLGAGRASRSTLAEANAQRSSSVFTGLLTAIIAQTERGLRRKIGDAVRLIDSTGLKLSSMSGWAQFSANVCGAKLHVVYDADADRPLYVEVTTARVNDISQAKAMPIEAGATYVFDLGYYDFGWWADLDARGCRIVTRLKKNTPLAVIAALPVPPGSAVLSDRIGHLPVRLAYSRKNPFREPVREVCVTTETGKELRILTNDLDTPADEIAGLYKRRWQVELFFRWIKQTLKIKHFIGTSENAVRIQVAVALIAFIILRLAQAAAKTINSPLAFARLVRANLMHRRPIDRLLALPDPPIRDRRQIAFNFTQI